MLDRKSSKPLHQQMEEEVRHKLDSLEWQAGQAIPSENELSRMYGISRMTLRNVITKLVQEGLLVRTAGKGTFVAEHPIIAKSLAYAGIREQLEQMGYEVTTKLLSMTQQTESEKIRAIFQLSDPDAPFYVISRLRYLRGQPFSIHTSYIPVQMSPGLEAMDLEREQLCVVLSRQYGLIRRRTAETLESIAATQSEAKLLQVKTGHPLLLLEDFIYNESGRVFEYAKVVFRGEKIKLHLEF